MKKEKKGVRLAFISIVVIGGIAAGVVWCYYQSENVDKLWNDDIPKHYLAEEFDKAIEKCRKILDTRERLLWLKPVEHDEVEQKMDNIKKMQTHLDVVDTFLSDGDYDKAFSKLKDAQTIDPHHPGIQARLQQINDAKEKEVRDLIGQARQDCESKFFEDALTKLKKAKKYNVLLNDIEEEEQKIKEARIQYHLDRSRQALRGGNNKLAEQLKEKAKKTSLTSPTSKKAKITRTQTIREPFAYISVKLRKRKGGV